MARFKPGQSGNPKGGKIGHKGGGGRPPEWLKAKCQELIDRNQLIEFLADVAAGKDVDQRINENGEVLKIPADVKDRLKATEMLLDRGFGKATQVMDLGQTETFPFTIIRPGEVKVA